MIDETRVRIDGQDASIRREPIEDRLGKDAGARPKLRDVARTREVDSLDDLARQEL